ncbi:MAG: hypothetical protein ACREP6_00755 [Candidatus Binataceae bacterium]
MRAPVIALWAALIGALCFGAVDCGNNGFVSVSGIKNVPGQLSFRVVGVLGTPFSAIVSDAHSSWKVQGMTPYTVAIVGGQPPYRMAATKTISNRNLMSVVLLNGFQVTANGSTSEPFGTVVVQNGGAQQTLPPTAFPDVRFFLRGPNNALVSGIIEDRKRSIAIEQRAPTMFLFDQPSGRVDGIFNEINTGAGNLTIYLYFTQPPNPTFVCRQFSSTAAITVKYPGCTATPLAQMAELPVFGGHSLDSHN